VLGRIVNSVGAGPNRVRPLCDRDSDGGVEVYIQGAGASYQDEKAASTESVLPTDTQNLSISKLIPKKYRWQPTNINLRVSFLRAGLVISCRLTLAVPITITFSFRPPSALCKPGIRSKCPLLGDDSGQFQLSHHSKPILNAARGNR
jgi:hypothetical protein